MQGNPLTDIGIIILLLLVNAFFSAAEIAIISLRESKIKQLIGEGKPTAKLLMQLRSAPDHLFATLQAGITIINTIASAFAGVTLIDWMKNFLTSQSTIPFLQWYADPIAFFTVVLSISYFTIVVGELLPKSIGYQYASSVALATVRPIAFVAKILHPAVIFLTLSKTFISKLLGIHDKEKLSTISEEEVKMLVREGKEKGIFDKTEHEIITNAFSFTETTANEIMTPNFKVHAVEVDATDATIVKIIIESGNSRFPVYKDRFDTVIGVVSIKDVFRILKEKKHIDLQKIMMKPLFVPESEIVSHLLKTLQKARQQIAIVVNEYGQMEGVVTVEDIVEELVGEIRDETDTDEIKEVRKIKDGMYMVDGAKTIKDLHDDFKIKLPESDEYDTIGGFIFSQLQAVPEEKTVVELDDMRFTVIEVDGNRIAKVKVEVGIAKKKESLISK